MAEKEGKSTKQTAEFFKGASDVLETGGYFGLPVKEAVLSFWEKKGFLKSLSAGLVGAWLLTLVRELWQNK